MTQQTPTIHEQLAEQGHMKSQHVALQEVYPEMTRKERRKFITENVPKIEGTHDNT